MALAGMETDSRLAAREILGLTLYPPEDEVLLSPEFSGYRQYRREWNCFVTGEDATGLLTRFEGIGLQKEGIMQNLNGMEENLAKLRGRRVTVINSLRKSPIHISRRSSRLMHNVVSSADLVYPLINEWERAKVREGVADAKKNNREFIERRYLLWRQISAERDRIRDPLARLDQDAEDVEWEALQLMEDWAITGAYRLVRFGVERNMTSSQRYALSAGFKRYKLGENQTAEFLLPLIEEIYDAEDQVGMEVSKERQLRTKVILM